MIIDAKGNHITKDEHRRRMKLLREKDPEFPPVQDLVPVVEAALRHRVLSARKTVDAATSAVALQNPCGTMHFRYYHVTARDGLLDMERCSPLNVSVAVQKDLSVDFLARVVVTQMTVDTQDYRLPSDKVAFRYYHTRLDVAYHIEAPSTPVVPRPSVHTFSQDMELQLRANDHKGGWDKCSRDFFIKKLDEEVRELVEALRADDVADILGEAADVGNVAMMISDSTRKRSGIC